MGGRFCPPLQRSNLNFPRGYVPVFYVLAHKDTLIYADALQSTGNSSDSDGWAPFWRPPFVGGDTSQGLEAIFTSSPNHLVDRTRLQSCADSFPSDPCKVFP